jgi:hypothetical protein
MRQRSVVVVLICTRVKPVAVCAYLAIVGSC